MEEIESPSRLQQNTQPGYAIQDEKRSKAFERSVLILNFVIMIVGACSGPLLLRLYVTRGGNRKWLNGWLISCGWPILLVPLAFSYCSRRKASLNQNSSRPVAKPYLMTPPLFLASAILGFIAGLSNFFYAYGISYLPVSTATLVSSTQLAFTAFFAFIIVKQKFTAYTINAVVLLSLGVIVLGIHSNGDRPHGEGKGMYYLGLVMMLGAAAAFGLMLSLMELSQQRAKVAMSYTVVMEMQVVIGFFATVFCTVGTVVNKDFQAMAAEATEHGLGEAIYCVILISAAITFQLYNLGTIGSIFYANALLAGIIQAALTPVIQVLALFFFHDPFDCDKGVALGLCLWGSASYFYGEFKAKQDSKSVN